MRHLEEAVGMFPRGAPSKVGDPVLGDDNAESAWVTLPGAI
ncbi:hypothetical protein QOZ89_34580 [Pseudofrankia sp. BMG5.37]|nr:MULTISPECIES: hypothetical protein [unclassified Pseudofrankia]MDT3444695.1 hypothetical protein [Pseudofrankia sp. BMG5.37]